MWSVSYHFIETIVKENLVRTEHDISQNLIVGHLNMSNSNSQTENLLQLELDGGTNLGDLVVEVFSMGNRGWEFTS